ncbi:hypothetical protein J5N97_009518 [Dioscorea zingiberensis]|uniref:Uncharacterized protein n=1 Tax=Dioscorea zingiberensis TaxID=325984 RepID=A0A9D5CZI3_9LILI|nr:hypothetical protein J5N97_009518 [Dioscorea zingiberensis]
MDLLRPIIALGSCYATNDWSSCAIVNAWERFNSKFNKIKPITSDRLFTPYLSGPTKAQEKTHCDAVFVIYFSTVSYDKVHKTSEKKRINCTIFL